MCLFLVSSYIYTVTLALVSRHPVYDLMRDYLTLSWARFSKDVQSHTLQISKILAHPAPRAGDFIKLDASPKNDGSDSNLEVVARFPGGLDFGRGLVDINFTMWPLFKCLNIDNILTICEVRCHNATNDFISCSIWMGWFRSPWHPLEELFSSPDIRLCSVYAILRCEKLFGSEMFGRLLYAPSNISLNSVVGTVLLYLPSTLVMQRSTSTTLARGLWASPQRQDIVSEQLLRFVYATCECRISVTFCDIFWQALIGISITCMLKVHQ